MATLRLIAMNNITKNANLRPYLNKHGCMIDTLVKQTMLAYHDDTHLSAICPNTIFPIRLPT